LSGIFLGKGGALAGGSAFRLLVSADGALNFATGFEGACRHFGGVGDGEVFTGIAGRTIRSSNTM
jgi:hypothetical protein